MTLKTQAWIPAERVEAYVQIEPALFLLVLAACSWLFYRFALKNLSAERHRNLTRQFKSVVIYTATSFGLFAVYLGMQQDFGMIGRAAPTVGLLTLAVGSLSFIKTCRIILFEWLFFSHMTVGVPLLLVNIFTLVLSIVMAGWIASGVFGVQLAPLLATSAALSLVLGLALQDTLGNLFAGLALQLDKPYEIGDWIEITNGPLRWSGQVQEVSWRATVLLAFTEELITIPNRIMSAGEVSNFSAKHRPIIRGQVFKIPYGSDTNKAKAALLRAIATVPEVRKSPAPLVLMQEPTESWMPMKLVYFIENYGRQFFIADQAIRAALAELEAEGIHTAPNRLQVNRD